MRCNSSMVDSNGANRARARADGVRRAPVCEIVGDCGIEDRDGDDEVVIGLEEGEDCRNDDI